MGQAAGQGALPILPPSPPRKQPGTPKTTYLSGESSEITRSVSIDKRNVNLNGQLLVYGVTPEYLKSDHVLLLMNIVE